MPKEFSWSEIEDDDEVINYYAYYGDEELGFIEWYPKWKKWIWNQKEDIIMSFTCMKEVTEKLRSLEVMFVKPERTEKNRKFGGDKIMNQIKFSHNWNNKLNCNIFTTIRADTLNKYHYYKDKVMEKFEILLNNKKVSEAMLRKVSQERLVQIRPTIARLDTGFFEEDKIFEIFKKFGVEPKDNVLLLTFTKIADKTGSTEEEKVNG